MSRRCSICRTLLAHWNLVGPMCAECRLLLRNGDLDVEMWLPVPTARGFEASNAGRVRSASTRRLCHVDRSTRVAVRGARRLVSHLVAEAWLGPRPEGALVLHANGIPYDCRVENLSYGRAADRLRNRGMS